MSVSEPFSKHGSHAVPEAIGPYSPWPRETAKRVKRAYVAAGSAFAAAAAFVHCIVPLL